MDASRTLTSIVSTAQRIRDCIPHALPSPVPRHRRISLTLPDPVPIAHHLVRVGWSNVQAEYLSDVYMRQAVKKKLDYEKAMNNAINACLKLGPWTDVQHKLSQIHAYHEAMYLRDLERWTETAMQRISEFKSFQTPHPSSKRSLLDSTSVLEKAFMVNPYPTSDEKQAIADLTGMNHKQVHIWFQNRRSRHKRDGKEVRKLRFVANGGSHLHIPQAFAAHESSPIPPSSPRASMPLASNNSSMGTSGRASSFHLDRPRHAFPNTFPPVCDYNPFPILDCPGGQMFDIPWPRLATSDLHRSRDGDLAVAVDQLCASISCLALSDDHCAAGVPRPKVDTQKRRLRNCAVSCFPYLIRPPTAPLPALVPATVTVHTTTSSQHPLSLSPLLSRHTVGAPSLSAPSPKQTSPRKSRDVIPSSWPQSMPKLARDSAHPYQSHKTARPRTKQARQSRLSSMTSLSSLASDDSCSSRASSASLESPPPITPPQLSVELPRSRKVSSPDLVFSPSEDLDHLFSDLDTPTLNFLDDRQLNQPRIVQ